MVRARKPTSEVTVTAETGADYGYCTEVLIKGTALNVDAIRDGMEQIGNSVIVVGEPDLIHVHVHSHQPGDILNLAAGFGSLDRIKVENMQLQHSSYLATRPQPVTQVAGMGVVAVVAGAGLERVFKDLGACAIVHGGQTMNPSIEELVHAANSCGREKVILLPNNPNVILTAQQSQALVQVELRVVPTRTICEGVAAMVSFNPDVDLDEAIAAMKEATSVVQTIELTRAVRSTKVNGLEIGEGQAIGMLNGVLVEAGESVDEVALRVLEMAKAADHEVVTIYRGEEVAEAEGNGLAAAVTDRWPDLQVDVVDGGQPHYPYIISVE